jgi:hypothetical protein
MFNPRFRPGVLLGIVAVMIGIYGIWWFAQLRAFKQEISQLQSAQSPIQLSAKSYDFGGFPYRLEVVAKEVTLLRRRDDYALSVQAPELTLIRQPWQHGFYLGALVKPAVTLSAKVQPDFGVLTATADGAQVSVRSTVRGIGRLSVTFENFTSTLPWTQKKLTAKHMELHGREYVAHDSLPAWKPESATPPTLFEIYATGEDVMLARGPFILTARAEVTGDPKNPHGPNSLAAWRTQGGTVELRGFNLDRGTVSDTFAQGTFSLGSDNRVQGAATVDTGCVSWLHDMFDLPPPTVLRKCGSILHHQKLQVVDKGVTIVADER